ncbi:hypothetical protein GBAR_LOCUS13038 [Geodia barretti]|uniref:EF-hand domain-containing protein n=1 Tax=Geodia barretti TaxID=519541 RepID=A0AA35WPR8_GEOBA|nr:hypothetical protein GBAR_LOCUS13038 [Geodia barretti]
MSEISEVIAETDATTARQAEEQKRLRELDCFVLDNSLRESTVGALRGHTLENKWKIYEEVKRCGFKDVIVAAFSHNTRVDDHFVRQLAETGEDMSTFYAFSEGWGSISNGEPDLVTLPVGLDKMKTLQLQNPIIEIDLADSRIDWEKFTVERVKNLLQERIKWVKENLAVDGNVLINYRDFSIAMLDPTTTHRILSVTEFLARLPADMRPFGLIFEEPTGKNFPAQLGGWTAAVRKVMNVNDWNTGKLLVHVHEKWGLAEAAQLACLGNGANGVWASLCAEGAALGHACTSVSLLNLIRLGNKKVLERYNCTELRRAAMRVTEITSGRPPHPKQPVYGERALDMAFDFGGISGGHVGKSDFDLATFFGEEAPKRISTLASADMIQERLVNLFGDLDIFTLSVAEGMKKVMIDDLTHNRKEEYMSKMGLAVLFDRAGGSLTESMRDVIEEVEVQDALHQHLLRKVREMWDTWDLRESVELIGDECLEFDSFYNGFMAPYFGCFRCDDTRKGLIAIDMDSDGRVDWSEFSLYLKWALHQYPNIKDVDELLSVTFRKGIIPAMHDELLTK